jgi:hypothetical protein
VSGAILTFYDEEGRVAGAFAVADTPVTTVYTITPGIARVGVTLQQAAPEPPAPTREDSPEFRAHVLRWLREEKHIDAVSVEKVKGYGTDWAGDTNGGFYSDWSIDITYTDSAGKSRFEEVKGEDFLSLWHWVVSAWPAPELQL